MKYCWDTLFTSIKILEKFFNSPFEHFGQTVLEYQAENWQRNVKKVLINVYWGDSDSRCHNHLELVHFWLRHKPRLGQGRI